jgi:hypothetical protein
MQQLKKKIVYDFHESGRPLLPLSPILSQISPLHTLPSYFTGTIPYMTLSKNNFAETFWQFYLLLGGVVIFAKFCPYFACVASSIFLTTETQSNIESVSCEEIVKLAGLYFRTKLYVTLYKVVQILPAQTVTCLHTNIPGHIWTTLYIVHKLMYFFRKSQKVKG